MIFSFITNLFFPSWRHHLTQNESVFLLGVVVSADEIERLVFTVFEAGLTVYWLELTDEMSIHCNLWAVREKACIRSSFFESQAPCLYFLSWLNFRDKHRCGVFFRIFSEDSHIDRTDNLFGRAHLFKVAVAAKRRIWFFFHTNGVIKSIAMNALEGIVIFNVYLSLIGT